MKQSNSINLSIVIPLFNEEESIGILHEKLVKVLEKIDKSFEIILVDDGSTDNSADIINTIHQQDGRVKVIKFNTNMGKAKALARGFEVATGEIVFTMDADLQDDPNEIPSFLKKMDEGYDLVSGWKKKRHDPLEKRIPSKLFNKTVSLVTGLKLHDFNCGFKAYKREILDEIEVYGDLHRYIPALAHWQGYRVGEIPVQHHAREFGCSKYGWERYFRGFFDLFTVVLLTRFMQTPIYLFGLTGLFLSFFGFGVLAFLTYLQIIHGSILGRRPLSYLGVLSVLFGSQLIATGFVAEMLNQLKSRKNKEISIKNIFSHNPENQAFEISVVIPVHNERENIITFYDQLKSSLGELGKDYEVIFVDDGSSDGTIEILKGLQTSGKTTLKIVQLRKRFGKASALQAGFNVASGNVIITMDGDLQDNPDDISRFLNRLDRSTDMVVGRRTGVPFPRLLNSTAFNRVVSCITGSKVHDINCGLKAFKRHVLTDIRLYGELHRFLPLLVVKRGYCVAEIAVNHRERLHGKSKYGLARIPKTILDLFAVVLSTDFRARPLHLFGLVGLSIAVIGFFINLYLTILKIQTGDMAGHYTLLLMGVTLMILGFQWFSTGLLAEVINKLRHADKGGLKL